MGKALAAVFFAGLMVSGSSLAQAAAPEPELVLVGPVTPPPPKNPLLEPPAVPLELEGTCGLAVNAPYAFYLANYYPNTVDWIRTPVPQLPPEGPTPIKVEPVLANVDPLDGPCGLSLDTIGRIYVNNYHRNVERYSLSGGIFQTPTVIDSSHPTGVAVNPATNNVYVNVRTYLTAYGSSGAPLLDAGDPLKIGVGSLGDGYGLAVSQFPATAGRLYVPDHFDDTVKVYDPLINKANPVQTISGPPGGFGSLRDSAIAVDKVTGEIYVADTIAHPQHTERPEAVIRVFDAAGAYKGRLKYSIVDAEPPGLAVDNTAGATQGRVYVTSGNTVRASIYIYPAGSATSQSGPAMLSLAVRAEGSGGGSVQSAQGQIDCEDACESQVPAGARPTISAIPKPGSAFTGWSGADCTGTGPCTVTMDGAHSVSASFERLAGPSAPAPSSSPTATSSVITQKGNLRVSVNGRLDSTGLPSCNLGAIQPGSSSRALSACRSSLVGEGSFTANITLAGQEPYPTKGKLLVFNAREKGKPVLYGHIYAPKPFATSFVIVFAIQKLGKGTYGTALNAPLPAAMDAWGRLTGLQMTLQRRYSFKGQSRSFISAGCPAPKGFTQVSFPLARTEFAFDGGKKLSSVLSSTCRVGG